MSDPNGPHLAPVPDVDGAAPRTRTKVKKLRLLALLIPLAVLAIVSTVFGMMMAVAADVNGLDTTQIFRVAHSSRLTDVNGQPLGILSEQNRVVVPLSKVSIAMRNAEGSYSALRMARASARLAGDRPLHGDGPLGRDGL